MYWRQLKSLAWIVSVLAIQPLATAAQESTAPAASQGGNTAQANNLEKQLEELKQQYEATTHDLQTRIAALEQQIQKQKEESEKAKQGTVSAAELAAEKVAHSAVLGESDQVGAHIRAKYPRNRPMTFFTRPTQRSKSCRNR